MNINFILPSFPWKPTGGFRVVYEYANNLALKGHNITIIHPRYLPNKDNKQRNYYFYLRKKVSYFRNLIPRPKIKWQAMDKKVKMVYVQEPTKHFIPDADIVIATLWATAELVLDLPLSKGEKFYLIQGYEIWCGPEERVNSTWLGPLYKIVIAKWLYEKGVELGVPANQMIHIPNGINHKLFKLNIPIDKRPNRVAMMYSNAIWKGGIDGINVLEMVKESFPMLKAILFSVDSRPKGLPKWIDFIQNPKLSFLVENIYNNSSIYLCPSLTEGWHLPPAEAMSCGCAVVSTDIGGVRDYAIHGKTALLSPPQNPELLKQNIVYLLKNDDIRIKIAKSGYNHIQNFTWERSTDLLEKVLNKSITNQSF